jgi:hypothetical protein
MATIIRSEFNFGQVVYLKTDTEQYPRQVIGVKGTADGGILIHLISETESSLHYECEISEEPDIMMSSKH